MKCCLSCSPETTVAITMEESMNGKTIGGVRLLDSLAFPLKGVVMCSWKLCSKTINEIVFKMVRQNIGRSIVCSAMRNTGQGTTWSHTGSCEQFSSLSLWQLQMMTKGQIVLHSRIHDWGRGVLSSVILYLCGI